MGTWKDLPCRQPCHEISDCDRNNGRSFSFSLDRFPPLSERPEWHERASCRGIDTNLFFPERGRDGYTDVISKYCRKCTVRLQCLESANEYPHNLYGIFGGLTSKQRRLLRAHFPGKTCLCGVRKCHLHPDNKENKDASKIRRIPVAFWQDFDS